MRRAVLVVVVVLAIAGCGGGDDGGQSSTRTFCHDTTKVNAEFAKVAAYDSKRPPTPAVLNQSARQIATLAEHAPVAVRADLLAIADGDREIARSLAGIDLTNSAALKDPNNATKLKELTAALTAVSTKIEKATHRVAAYVKRACGIDLTAND